MRNLLTGDDLFAEILLLRNVNNKTFLILEGETDCDCLDPHVEDTLCETIPGYSKSAVLRAIELVDDQGVPGVVGLVDRDWFGFCELQPQSSNLFITDCYDLDATVFFSGQIAQRFFSAQGRRAERKAFLIACGASDVSSVMVKLALPIGYLRFISCRDGYGLKLRDFPLNAAIKQDCMALDIETLVNIACARSGGVPSISKQALVTNLIKDLQTIKNGREYCSGHDLARALATVVTRRLNLAVSNDTAARGIRAMFNATELKGTAFYVALKEWAELRKRVIWKLEYSL